MAEYYSSKLSYIGTNFCSSVTLIKVAILTPYICYLGRFGVEKDRMDKSAVGHDYQADLSKHNSQTDAAKGFGG